MPVIGMEAALRRLAPGGRLKVIADDPLAAIDIPYFCREAGHRVERLCASEADLAIPKASLGANSGANTRENPEKQSVDRATDAKPCVFMVTRNKKP